MQRVKVRIIKECAGLEKGIEKHLPLRLAQQVEKEGYVKIIGEPEKIERLVGVKRKMPEKVESKKAPSKKIVRKKPAETMLKENTVKQ